MNFDQTPNLANHLQKEIEKIQADTQLALQRIILAIWEESGDDTVLQALTRSNTLTPLTEALTAIGITFDDLEIETPSHLQDNEDTSCYQMDCARDNELTGSPE